MINVIKSNDNYHVLRGEKFHVPFTHPIHELGQSLERVV